MDKFLISRDKLHCSSCVSKESQESQKCADYFSKESKDVKTDKTKQQLNRTVISDWSGRKTNGVKEENKNNNKYKNLSDSFVQPNKRVCLDKELSYNDIKVSPFVWRTITAENLNLKYAKIFNKSTADFIFRKLEEEVEYFSGDLTKVKVYGKWHEIPRKQVSYGNPGTSYTFSNTCVPAVPWSKCNIIRHLRDVVESACQHSFNFVLVNRYKDGNDHMGEHRDDEKDLVETAPIASLSLGQARDFIFKHKDSRGAKCIRKMDPIKLELEHGSLLLMEWPTNRFWYHSLPVRKKAPNVRINLTFREMVKG